MFWRENVTFYLIKQKPVYISVKKDAIVLKNVLKDFVAKRLEMLIHFSSEPEAPILLTNGCRNIFPFALL